MIVYCNLFLGRWRHNTSEKVKKTLKMTLNDRFSAGATPISKYSTVLYVHRSRWAPVSRFHSDGVFQSSHTIHVFRVFLRSSCYLLSSFTCLLLQDVKGPCSLGADCKSPMGMLRPMYQCVQCINVSYARIMSAPQCFTRLWKSLWGHESNLQRQWQWEWQERQEKIRLSMVLLILLRT